MALVEGLPIHPWLVRSDQSDVGASRAKCVIQYFQDIEAINDICKPNTLAWWHAFGELCKESYWAFKYGLLQERWMDAFLHGDVVIDFCEQHRWSGICVLLPRGHGKTSVITNTAPAWFLAKNPSITGMVVNVNEDKAKQYAKVSADIIENNVRFKTAFPHIEAGSEWSSKGWRVVDKSNPGGIKRTDMSLNAIGIRGNATGSHLGFLLLDDLLNNETVKHIKEVQRAEDFCKEAMRIADPGSYTIINHTRWLSYDFLERVESGDITTKDGKPFKVLKLGAERPFKNEDGQWLMEIIFPKRTFVDVKGREGVVGETKSSLEGYKKTDPDFYSALYMNEPQTDEMRQFTVDMITTFKETLDLPFDCNKVSKINIETDGAGQSLVDSIKIVSKLEGWDMPIRETETKRTNKHDRIRGTLQSIIANSCLRVVEHVWNSNELLGKEIRDFNKGLDDCLDACVHSIRGLSRDCEISIGVDPAFSVSRHSDFTAIVASTKFNGVYYILDCIKFKTSKTEVATRRLWQFYVAMQSVCVGGNARRGRVVRGSLAYRSDRQGRQASYQQMPKLDRRHIHRW